MTIKLICSKSKPSLGGLLFASYINSTKSNAVKIEWSDGSNHVENSTRKIACETTADVLRALVVILDDGKLYGTSDLEKTQVDHWLCYAASNFALEKGFASAVASLNKILGPLTYLVGKRLTIADIAVFSSLYANERWISLISKNEALTNVLRWYKFIESQDYVKSVLNEISTEIRKNIMENSKESSDDNKESSAFGGRAKEGKFVELPGAEMGKVVVRFPPEASGYLHIGHAKAALLNQYYQQAFDGKLIMRFDDTNPAKENTHFEEVILEDVAMLQIKPDRFTYTSDYFELMLEYCEKMIKDGTAYVDDTDPEIMKQEREQKVESANRKNDISKNLKMWGEMKNGTEYGQKCCVRAKIDMTSLNGCMRDPTIYRCKNEPHPRTGTKYKVYPTYDFACPIVDAIEGVTHTLRTMEYHDRDPQFYWFIDVLGLRKPHIWEYSRLSMTNTVLSKRKLTWFVEQGLVDGWDDPRMPTVRGVLRRGMTVEGLKEFIIAQGSSRSVVFMEWDKIWAFNKKVIDPIVPRYTVVDFKTNVPVFVKNVKEECLTVPKHPKNPEVGTKSVWIGPKLLIDKADAECLKEGENATFIHWGNLMIQKINKENGQVVSVEAEPNIDNKDFKKTAKLTFLCDTNNAKFTPTFFVYFDHIISKPLLGKDEDFKQFIGHETRKDLQVLGDPELRNLKQGDIIQIQRRGYFRVDVPFGERSEFSCKEQPVILFHVPDGSAKDNIFASLDSKQNSKVESKIKNDGSKNGKSAESINKEIVKQGNVVRDLKSKKAGKTEIDAAVKKLLDLKAEYKNISGAEWKPGVTNVEKKETKVENGKSADSVNEKIVNQGNIVRDLKSKKASKTDIDAAVKILLNLKEEYKNITGSDWKPGLAIDKKEPKVEGTKSAGSINDEIVKQGNLVRDLKSKKANKTEIDAAVKILLDLKVEFKKVSGSDWKPGLAINNLNEPKVEGGKSANSINNEIVKQGNIVRDLKSKKASKADIDASVRVLLDLKAEFKKVSGSDWKPGLTLEDKKESKVEEKSAASINEDIVKQGNVVRDLKSKKASKTDINAAVKILLDLKGEYKKVSGSDWKPGIQQSESPTANVDNLSKKIAEQGDKVRQLKSQKAGKSTVDAEVKVLLSLKSEYKTIAGKDWILSSDPAPKLEPEKTDKSTVDERKDMEPSSNVVKDNSSGDSGSANDELTSKINAQGNLVRDLKTKKANKEEIDGAVKVLLDLKAEYKKVTGTDFPSAGKPNKTSNNDKPKTPRENKSKPKKEAKPTNEDSNVKKQTRLGLEAKKEEDLPSWYSQVITKGELIEYYDVSGCYIYRPWAFSIWEAIRDWFDAEIKKLGVQNCYFPIFVSKAMLEKEKSHIADFSPEVAWVTKSGDSDMSEPIAVRPTSETVMYPAYAKWIQSYRDLPIKLNQWNNVVRWEFKHPQPFLRTREFLWQEGHTAYATFKEAEEEVSLILDLYAKIYTDLLAVPVIKGRKTTKEKFAGGDYTYTVEAYISASGRAIQGATSHHLGQNFSIMFDIIYEDPETQEKKFVYQNSWGITTRSIGVMIMVHSDNQGLVLPPNVANIQVIIVPCGITVSLPEEQKKKLLDECNVLENDLKSCGIRAKGDFRMNYSPGWKFNHWELTGVPVRVELGPKDLEKNQFVAVRRDTGEKITLQLKEANEKLKCLLETIHKNLFAKASDDLNSHIALFKDWSQFIPNLEKKNLNLVPFCGRPECEDKIKADSTKDETTADAGAPSMGAKSLCVPLEQPAPIQTNDKCIHPSCKENPLSYTLFGRSY